jgi:hypothetical protein
MNLVISQGSDVVEVKSVLRVRSDEANDDVQTSCSYSPDREAAADMLHITTDASTKQCGQ